MPVCFSVLRGLGKRLKLSVVLQYVHYQIKGH